MSYPKVKDFLSHVVTGTNVLIEDDIIEDYVYFEGTVRDYIDSVVSLENLTLIQSSVKDNVLNLKALKDYDQD